MGLDYTDRKSQLERMEQLAKQTILIEHRFSRLGHERIAHDECNYNAKILFGVQNNDYSSHNV